MKVVIIGGGIIGLTSAYYLQKRGFEVTVIDKGNISNGCSFGNAGYVSPSHFIPLASPGIIAQGLRWMLSSTSPFYIKPRLNPDLIRWGLTFWRHANKETMERNSVYLNELLQLSRQLTSEINTDLGDDFLMQEQGCFMLYKSPETEKHERELAEKAAKFQIETRILSAAEVQELEPDVRVNVRGGVLYPIDAHLHPGAFMKSMLEHLQRSGVRIIQEAAVKKFEKVNGSVKAVITDKGKVEGDEFILSAGSWLPRLAAMLQVKILLQPGKGYSMTFSDVERNLHRPAILVDDRVAMTPLGKDLRIGGTMEISGINERILPKRVRAIFEAAKKYYPDLPIEFPEAEKVWSGLRPLSPDGLPYIGRAKNYGNLIIAGGHAMLGVSLAAGTGRLVEEMISRKPASVTVEAFALERFN